MPIEWPWRRLARKTAGTWETFRSFYARPVKSGAVVNTATALEVTTALACARVIAEGIAQVPFKLHQLTGRDRREAIDHPAFWLLAKRPNDWQTSFEFREQIALHLVLCGDAFVFKNMSGDGRILELMAFEPGQVRVIRAADYSLSYRVTTGGGEVDVPAASMWHLRGLSWNGYIGLKPVALAREALGLALATEEHSARMFANGARIGGVLSGPGSLTKEQIALLRQQWEESQGGPENAYRTAVLFGGLEWKPMGQPNDEAQLIDSRRFQVEEVCRAMRVMPIMVGAGEKTSTYASSEQMFLAHVTHTLMPWYRRIEDSADVNLLGLDALRKGFYCKFTANALLRGSVQARGEFYKQLYGIAAISPNEIRELEDMNPYTGGDQYRAPLNMEDPANPDNPPKDPAK